MYFTKGENFFHPKHFQVIVRAVGQRAGQGKNKEQEKKKKHFIGLRQKQKFMRNGTFWSVSAPFVIWPIKDSPYWIPPAKSWVWSTLGAH